MVRGPRAGAGDTLEILGTDKTDNAVVLTNTGFTLNGAAGTTAGVELIEAVGNDGDDTIDGSALSTAVQLLAHGGRGDDWIAPGRAFPFAAPFDGDVNAGATPTRSATARVRPACSRPRLTAGHDANSDGDVLDPGDERTRSQHVRDLPDRFGQRLADRPGGAETFIPGDGDDNVTGGAGVDTIDWSSSSALMTIDPDLGTATGQGKDTYSGVEAFVGSAFDDVADLAGRSGLAGSRRRRRRHDRRDRADHGPDHQPRHAGPDHRRPRERARRFGTDAITGNDLRNDLQGNDGDDTLLGVAGNDTLTGGLGNDTFAGGTGADKISYATNATDGVNVDMNLGFATSPESGDDGFSAPNDVEIVQGSPFNDSITGGGGITTVNFLFTGGNGKDILTGSGSQRHPEGRRRERQAARPRGWRHPEGRQGQ